jgi:hypothetical protein
MAKLDLPQGFSAKPTAGGTRYYWQPSARQRKAGWKGLPLGRDLAAAIKAAEARNAEVAAIDAGGGGRRDVRAAIRRGTMGWLIDRFERDHVAGLAASSQHEYKSALRAIRTWTEDGKAPIASITRQRVQVLKKALLTPAAGGHVKAHRAASILRILRVLMQFALNQELIGANPVEKAGIPEPPPRSRIVSGPAIEAIMASAVALGRPSVALGVMLGLWTLQRQGDILRLGEANWRPLGNVPGEARAVLQDGQGVVMGFRLKQGKTKEWVEIALAGDARRAVEAQLAALKAEKKKVAVVIADEDEDRPYPQWKFQRQFRAAVDHARAAAEKAGDAALAEDLTGIEYRDLRRTGMCLMREFGVPVEYIASVSGHSIDRTKKILETYLPRNPRTAAQAMAIFTAAMEAQAETKKARDAAAGR